VEHCILCGSDAIINRQENSSRTIYNCPYCGVYVASDPEEQRIIAHSAKIAAFLMTRKIKAETDAVLISYKSAKLDKEYLQLTTDQIVSYFPKSFAGQMDKALLNLGKMSRFPGDIIKFEDLKASPRLYVANKSAEAVFYMLKALKEAGYITYDQRKFPCEIVVSPKGLERIETLNGDIEGAGTLYCCAARDGNPHSLALEQVMEKLAEELGLKLRFFCDDRPDCKAGDALLAGIKSARAVVCDFTVPSGGVYSAAALANGMGKLCVSSCHTSAADALEIDASQFPVIFWENGARLQAVLLTAIKARM
jgi:hypothetical protein